MFTYTRREASRVDSFLAAIHVADCADDCCSAPPADDAVLLPTFVARAAADEPAVLESSDRRTVVALVGLLVVLFACLAGGLMTANPPHPAAPAHELVDLTSDNTADRTAEQVTR